MNRTSKVDSERIPFHAIQTGAMVSGNTQVLGIPASMAPRLGVAADVWAHYRIRKLKFRLHPSADANAQAAGWVGGVQDTTPTTVTMVSELIPATYLAGEATVPTEWVVVPKVDLAGPFPWYKTVSGTPDTTEEYPGMICIAGTGTGAYAIELRGEYEFKTAVNTGNTPAAVALRAKLRDERINRIKKLEQDRILAILSPTALKT